MSRLGGLRRRCHVIVQQVIFNSCFQVTAIDRDIGNNSAVAYYIIDGISAFDMRVDTGEIIVNHSLSGTKQNFQHRLTVEARDKGCTLVR